MNKKKIIIGFLWICAGALLTIFSYSAAEDGGTYFIFWGLCIYGLIIVIQGLKEENVYNTVINSDIKRLRELEGKRIERELKENKERFCEKCGNKVEFGSNFCEKCGNKTMRFNK